LAAGHEVSRARASSASERSPRAWRTKSAACARYVDLKPLLNLLDELEPRDNQAGYTF